MRSIQFCNPALEPNVAIIETKYLGKNKIF